MDIFLLIDIISKLLIVLFICENGEEMNAHIYIGKEKKSVLDDI